MERRNILVWWLEYLLSLEHTQGDKCNEISSSPPSLSDLFEKLFQVIPHFLRYSPLHSSQLRVLGTESTRRTRNNNRILFVHHTTWYIPQCVTAGVLESPPTPPPLLSFLSLVKILRMGWLRYVPIELSRRNAFYRNSPPPITFATNLSSHVGSVSIENCVHFSVFLFIVWEIDFNWIYSGILFIYLFIFALRNEDSN